MVNALKKNLSPLLVGRSSKLTKTFTGRHHQANEGNSGLEAESVWALGVLGSLQSKNKLSAEKSREMHFLSNLEQEKWIKDYVDRVMTEPRKRVEYAETASKQEQEDMRNAEKAGMTTGKHKKSFKEILNRIGDSLNHLASSFDEEDGTDDEDDQEDTELRKLHNDDEPGWVMGIISKW